MNTQIKKKEKCLYPEQRNLPKIWDLSMSSTQEEVNLRGNIQDTSQPTCHNVLFNNDLNN